MRLVGVATLGMDIVGSFLRSGCLAGLVFAGLASMACNPRASVHTKQSPAAAPRPLVEAAAATPAQLCHRRGLRSWTILTEQRVVGTTRGMCLGEDEQGWHFVNQVRLSGETEPLYELHLWLSDQGKPRTADLRTATSVVQFRWSEEHLAIESLGDLRVVSSSDDTPATRVWVVPAHAVYLRELMLRLGVGAEAAGAIHLTYVPDRAQVVPILLRWRRDGDALLGDASQGQFELYTGDAPTYDTLRITAAKDPQGATIYKSQPHSPMWEPSLAAVPKPTYALAPDLQVSPVQLDAEDSLPALAGEWVLTKDNQADSLPGAVLLSDSGLQDRHGLMPGMPIDTGYHSLQDALARAGFLVARFDDPGTGGSDALPPNADFDDATGVARRMVQWLAHHPRVDPAKIVLIGHGEGALTASLLARERFGPTRRRKPLAGLVVMAMVGRNVREVIEWQVGKGDPTTESAPTPDEINRIDRVHQALLDGDPVSAEIEPRRAWLTQLFGQNPLKNLERVRVPILALQGGRDFQVDPQLDFEPVRALVEGGTAGGTGSEAALFPELDHLFKPERGRSTVGHYGDLTRQVDPSLIARIVEWARLQAGVGGARIR